jgi:hypothetical protein
MLLQTQIVSDMEELPSGGYVVRLRALEQNAAVMELSIRVANTGHGAADAHQLEKGSETLYAHLLTTLLKSE